jgi:DNA-binding winged helix-turn-helix (wHTH) protein
MEKPGGDDRMIYRFGDCELDEGRYELRRGGVPCHLEPQVFEVLAYLVRNRGRLVTKAELLDEIWGSRFVSESALTSRIKAARKAVGDSGREQRVIRTVHGRGYEFLTPVQPPATGPSTAAARAGAVDGGEPAPSASATLPLQGGKARIRVGGGWPGGPGGRGQRGQRPHRRAWPDAGRS